MLDVFHRGVTKGEERRKRWYDLAEEDGGPRANQIPPPGDWSYWIAMAGRGWGKTRCGSEWINDKVCEGNTGPQVLIAGRTPADLRDYALYGAGGLLTNHPEVVYSPSARTVTWPNGVIGLIRSGANPEEFRGFSGSTAWLDEFAAWDYPEECWNNLIFGIREGDPQILITTTPRPIKTLKMILKKPSTVVVRGSSQENRKNLSAKWIKEVLEPLEGTRLGRQEINAEFLDDVEGALWKLVDIDMRRVKPHMVPELKRIVIAVDPQGSKKGGHETGIVAAGLGVDKHFYVLEDASLNGTPLEWGTKAINCLAEHDGDKIVGEKNFGGDMVEHTIRTIEKNVSFSLVNASRGKTQRAEPIAALYEKGVVHHVGGMPKLEDEMTTFTIDTNWSPNRMDALVWALTELKDGNKVRSLTW